MRIKRTLSLAALSLALTASFSTAAVFADAPTNAPKSHDIDITAAVKQVTVINYYNVGDGVPKSISYSQDGWNGTLVLVSYENANGVIAARYTGNVYK
ncbi:MULTISPECIES: hypothetical protein [Paenibacillus]|uniref:hypothetical protein n=1 Tax=Paenibacillus TaxID=44249 RepID=UPI0002F60092|nr:MULTISPECIES: hypothetical protein [Paenibacillus]KKD53496.1 hypothetical protein C400_17910 [Paenibacillus sp. ICGEB2008]